MSYPYNRQVAAAPPQTVASPQVPRGFQPVQAAQYPPQNFYYQATPQQPFPTTFVVPPGTQQPFQMMQFAPAQAGQQSVFVADEKFAQPGFIPMGMQPIQNQIRYAPIAAQAPAPPPPQPQVVQTPEARRKVKKEVPQAPYKRPIQPVQQQQVYIPQQGIIIPPPAPSSQSPPAAPQYQELESIQQSTETLLPKAPQSIMLTEFTTPPGCFNIIRRGNLPGLSFTSF